MPISIEEAQERELQAIKAVAENEILSQWYWCLGDVLKTQQEEGADEPDFSSTWINVDSYAVDAYYQSIGQDRYPGKEEAQQRKVAFVQELIGDQLEELGLILEHITVTNGIDDARRIYIHRPGEKAKLRD